MNPQSIMAVIRVIATPSCWVQIYPYSRIWDSKLRKLMQTGKFKALSGQSDINPEMVSIGGRAVWVNDHPFGSFRPYGEVVRPSRATILAAYDKFTEDLS